MGVLVDDEVRLLLDNLFLREEAAASQSPFRLTLLKRLSQSARPAKIREPLVDLGILKELHDKVAPILSVLALGAEGIRYSRGVSHECAQLIYAAGPMKIFMFT